MLNCVGALTIAVVEVFDPPPGKLTVFRVSHWTTKSEMVRADSPMSVNALNQVVFVVIKGPVTEVALL